MHKHPLRSNLKAPKQVVQLLWRKVPGQLDQHVMNVFDNDLMLSILSRPYPVQIIQAKNLLLNAEANQSVQLLHILGLVKVVPEHNGQHIVLPDPHLCNFIQHHQLMQVK